MVALAAIARTVPFVAQGTTVGIVPLSEKPDSVSVVVQVAALFAASFTVMVTVCAPAPDISEPAAGSCVIVRLPEGVTPSVAATSPVRFGTRVVQPAPVARVRPGAQLVIVGGVTSQKVAVTVVFNVTLDSR